MNERNRCQRFVFLLGILTSAALTASSRADEAAANWPRFHGPHGTNMSAETGLLRQWA